MSRFKRFLPNLQMLEKTPWLRWMGPALRRPSLWRVTRHGVALGVALGVFFGLLVPIAQIPLSAAAAVALRANLPAAVASTLVTNPLTFGPVYYAAWRVGSAVLGEPVGREPPPPEALAGEDGEASWVGRMWRHLSGVGKPLVAGLAIMATGVGVFAYFAVAWIWTLRKWWSRRRALRAGTRVPRQAD